MAFHNDLGKKGEEIAAEYLNRNGYDILEKNWRYLKAEIDIIAKKENLLAIVEVKTRSSINIISPEQSINAKKIKLLVSAANEYVVQNELDIEVRFDIITIHKKGSKYDLHHIKEAFLFF
jgi:putative endonuclease|tara:strand:+ start:580 stop:939 length:360 start_codon:yes stop_codon:yes gene_type:complete